MINLLYSISGQARHFNVEAEEAAFAAADVAPVATD
jgi:hypothetical protein